MGRERGHSDGDVQSVVLKDLTSACEFQLLLSFQAPGGFTAPLPWGRAKGFILSDEM